MVHFMWKRVQIENNEDKVTRTLQSAPLICLPTAQRWVIHAGGGLAPVRPTQVDQQLTPLPKPLSG